MVKLHVGALGIEGSGIFLIPRTCHTFLTFTFTQVKIAEDPVTHGSMFCPIIMGAEKKRVSVATGNIESLLVMTA